jgi:hypothetical protein
LASFRFTYALWMAFFASYTPPTLFRAISSEMVETLRERVCAIERRE